MGNGRKRALSKAVTTTSKLLVAIALSCVLLAACAETGGNPSATTTESPTGETTTGGSDIGEAFAEAELGPVGDSSVSGNVVFKEVGSLGVQVELEVAGLPAPGNPEEPKPYFAQVHEGSCSEAPRGGDQEREEDHGGDDHHGHEHGALGPSLALVHFDLFLPDGREEYADHSEYEPPPADEMPGNIDAPIEFLSSDDGTAFVTNLLEGVEPEQLSAGGPKYMDLRAPSHQAPEHWLLLACAGVGEGG